MRLTANEIRENKQWLAGWFSPTEMRENAQRLMDKLGCEDLFGQPDVDFVCEAWVAAELGEKRGASAVRLIAEERPDLALRFGGGEVEIYELVEADRLDRRRGDEYAALAAAGSPTYHWPVEEWATAEQAFSSIRAMAEKKGKESRGTSRERHTLPRADSVIVLCES